MLYTGIMLFCFFHFNEAILAMRAKRELTPCQLFYSRHCSLLLGLLSESMQVKQRACSILKGIGPVVLAITFLYTNRHFVGCHFHFHRTFLLVPIKGLTDLGPKSTLFVSSTLTW